MKIKIFLLLFFSLITTSLFSQSLEEVISHLDIALINQDTTVLNRHLHKDLYFGHSNAWTQSKEDVFNDLKNGILEYKSIETITKISKSSLSNHTFRISREIHVIGRLKEHEFDMQLRVLEIWILEDNIWKLWSRQSVKIN